MYIYRVQKSSMISNIKFGKLPMEIYSDMITCRTTSSYARRRVVK